MRRILALLLAAALAIAVAAPAVAAPATGITATPAATVTWAGTYTAKFVRSASGIINETNRVNSAGPQNGWTSADVYLQFRPLTGPDGTGDPIPNPRCDPDGLVTPPFTYVNSDPAIAGTPTSGYFIGTNPYNVCVYLVQPRVASGTIDVSVHDGATSAAVPLSGHFRVTVSGTWQNGPWWLVDPEYVQQMDLGGSAGTTLVWLDSWPGFAPDDFGDVMVNGSFVNWGAYTTTHTYSRTMTLAVGATVNLAVFDSYHADNVGALSYTITYLGL